MCFLNTGLLTWGNQVKTFIFFLKSLNPAEFLYFLFVSKVT